MKEEFIKFSEHLAEVGLQEKGKREREISACQQSMELACSTNQQLSVQRVKQFEEEKALVRRHSLSCLWS